MLIIGLEDRLYRKWYSNQGVTRNNGAYWYAKEIEELILPSLKEFNCIINTVGLTLYDTGQIPSGSVLVCHDNQNTEGSYKRFFGRGMIWVCSKKSTRDVLIKAGEIAHYVPLSVDTQYVKKFIQKRKTKGTAFSGNAWGFKADYLASLDKHVAQLINMERDDFLKEMAKYKKIIAEGRCSIEAQVLGAEVELPEFKDFESEICEVLDSRDAIPYWREVLETAPTFKSVTFTADIYPYCVGDTRLLNSQNLADIQKQVEKRRIAQPYKINK